MLFADNLRRSGNTALRSLQYKSSINELKTLESFVLRYVFSGSGDVELTKANDGELPSVLQSKRRVLAGFCKLCFNNILPVLRASSVFQYYEQVSRLADGPSQACLIFSYWSFWYLVPCGLWRYSACHHGALHVHQYD